MTQHDIREHMLSDDDRAFLDEWSVHGTARIPIEQNPETGKYFWTFRSHRSNEYDTRAIALGSIDLYQAMLSEARRVEHEQEYTVTRTPDQELLSSAIQASGLSVRAFAKDVLVREPRTVWRWLSGENGLPAAVRERLQRDAEKAQQGSKEPGTNG